MSLIKQTISNKNKNIKNALINKKKKNWKTWHYGLYQS